MKDLIQHNPPHPGEVLLNLYLEPLSINVTEAAEKLMVTRPNMSAILNGRTGIPPLMAMKLSKAFNTSPQLWLNLQHNYDLWTTLNSKENKRIIGSIKTLVLNRKR